MFYDILRFLTTFSRIGRGRSSHSWYSVKIGVLKNFENFTGKQQCRSFFSLKM